MKNITIILLFSLSFLFVNCQEEPVREIFPGLSDDDAAILLQGLLLNQTYTDNRDGTVTDTSLNLVWRKCTQGQVYRPGPNDCEGIERSFGCESFFTPAAGRRSNPMGGSAIFVLQ